MSSPAFSVVIPLYNKRTEIARCLQSVLAQTFDDFEVIVVDDGSKDDGPEIARGFTDPRIRVHSQSNKGLAGARNEGVALARAGWIAFLDADDEWLPGHLESIARLARREHAAGVLFSAFWIDRGGGWRKRSVVPSRFRHSATPLIDDYFGLPDGRILPSGTAVRKDAFTSAGGYRKMFGEDIDLLLRMAAAGPVAYSPHATAVWHVDASNRMCVDEEKDQASYQPGALLPSLKIVLEDPAIPAETKQRARAYVARREERAITEQILEQPGPHARWLYEWWQEQFGQRSQRIERTLALPSGVQRVLRIADEKTRKARNLVAYLRDRTYSAITFRPR